MAMLHKASEAGGSGELPLSRPSSKPPPPEEQLQSAESEPMPSESRMERSPTLNQGNYNISQLNRGGKLSKVVLYRLRDNIAVIATLIATFTYAASASPPGGVHQDGPLLGTAVAAKRTAFRVFFVCNNVALFASLGVVLFLLSMDIIAYRIKALARMMVIAHTAMWVAIFFMAAAYMAAWVVIMRPPGIRITDWTTVLVLATCGGSLGSVFVAVGITVVKRCICAVQDGANGPAQDGAGVAVQGAGGAVQDGPAARNEIDELLRANARIHGGYAPYNGPYPYYTLGDGPVGRNEIDELLRAYAQNYGRYGPYY